MRGNLSEYGAPSRACRFILAGYSPFPSLATKSVGAVYDRAFFMESTKYARSQTAPTVDPSLLGQAP
jgi:hypothetical protein